MGLRIDGAPASACAGDDGWWRPWRFGSRVGLLLTGLTERLVDQSGEGFGFFGTSASAWLGFKRRFRHMGRVVGQPDMNQQAEHHESGQQAWVKERIACHWGTGLSR